MLLQAMPQCLEKWKTFLGNLPSFCCAPQFASCEMERMKKLSRCNQPFSNCGSTSIWLIIVIEFLCMSVFRLKNQGTTYADSAFLCDKEIQTCQKTKHVFCYINRLIMPAGNLVMFHLIVLSNCIEQRVETLPKYVLHLRSCS